MVCSHLSDGYDTLQVSLADIDGGDDFSRHSGGGILYLPADGLWRPQVDEIVNLKVHPHDLIEGTIKSVEKKRKTDVGWGERERHSTAAESQTLYCVLMSIHISSKTAGGSIAFGLLQRLRIHKLKKKKIQWLCDDFKNPLEQKEERSLSRYALFL